MNTYYKILNEIASIFDMDQWGLENNFFEDHIKEQIIPEEKIIDYVLANWNIQYNIYDIRDINLDSETLFNPSDEYIEENFPWAFLQNKVNDKRLAIIYYLLGHALQSPDRFELAKQISEKYFGGWTNGKRVKKDSVETNELNMPDEHLVRMQIVFLAPTGWPSAIISIDHK